jgi:hypothetical protein
MKDDNIKVGHKELKYIGCMYMDSCEYGNEHPGSIGARNF